MLLLLLLLLLYVVVVVVALDVGLLLDAVVLCCTLCASVCGLHLSYTLQNTVVHTHSIRIYIFRAQIWDMRRRTTWRQRRRPQRIARERYVPWELMTAKCGTMLWYM